MELKFVSTQLVPALFGQRLPEQAVTLQVPDGQEKLVPYDISVELQTCPQLPQLLVVLKFVSTQLVPALFGQRLPEHAVALHVPDEQVKLVPYVTSLALQT